MKTRGQKIVDRILVSLGGGIVLCLDAFPLGVSIWFLYELMRSDGLPHKSSTIAVGFVSLLLFGAIACYAVRGIVRSWHNLVEVERMIESMTPSEEAEFRAKIGTSEDVEILVGHDGNRRSRELVRDGARLESANSGSA